uniref:Uncharacterized protein n=1 Tax=Physcomitrium patens TaxID=3218 RepID=A0A2K1JLM7_PHYPA|nr:hypothetical protein PHYPA_017285 [Physcomitrium patens]
MGTRSLKVPHHSNKWGQLGFWSPRPLKYSIISICNLSLSFIILPMWIHS